MIGVTNATEDAALKEAIERYKLREAPDDFRDITQFLARYPNSGWRVSLLTNLGLAYYHYGYFSRAISAWEEAWVAGRDASAPEAKALVDRAIGELARMHARLGHSERLSALFKEIGQRPISGAGTEAVVGAQEGLWMMQNEPGVAYLCGPMALRNLLLAKDPDVSRVRFISDYRSGPNGVSLAEVSQLARRANLDHRMVFRNPGQPIPVPSVIHWKVSHFAAVIGESGGRYHIKDPTFGADLWLTRTAIDSEASGYFLVPAGRGVDGMRTVTPDEASHVRGMGFTATNDDWATQESNDKTKPDSCSSGMCGYNINESVVSLTLKDTPVGYLPAKGPSAKISLTYNQREAGQPANFSYFNVGPKWTLNWLSYVQDDPTLPGATVTRYAAGGGYSKYQGYNPSTGAFLREIDTKSAAELVYVASSPPAYRRSLADGGYELYTHSDGATRFPRRLFLTRIVDPAGNAVTLNYDGSARLLSLTDATGRVTTFNYQEPSKPFLVTRITDPFGRSASLAYDAAGRLVQITDVLGLTSGFGYDASGLVTSLHTAYGTTTFAYGTGTGFGPSRFLEVTDPLGQKERVEYRQAAPGIASEGTPPAGIYTFNFEGSMYLHGRNTFYWDKHALPIARGDYTKARMKHWLHGQSGVSTSAVVESVKYPLEGRIWHNYPGQFGCGGCIGSLDKPSATGRILDDGSTARSMASYNFAGNPLETVDAAGRVTRYEYSADGLDLLRISQQTAPGFFSTIAEFTYNSQRRPLTHRDAAGETTRYAYNAAGQITQIADALGQLTQFEYDGLGQLIRMVNASNQTASSFTYDALGRIASRTDSEGHTIAFAYDALDRLLRVSFPDGTSYRYEWDKLDSVQ